MKKFSDRWNNLTDDERDNLMPHMIECEISNIKQCKEKVIRAHEDLITDFENKIYFLERKLREYEK